MKAKMTKKHKKVRLEKKISKQTKTYKKSQSK